MKITSRLALGFALLTLILIGATGYQLSIVKSVQEVNRELAESNLDAARISVRLLQGFEGVREFSEKYALVNDRGYLAQWEEWEGAVERELQRLASVEMGPATADERQVILDGWQAYLGEAEPLRVEPGEDPPTMLPPLTALSPEHVAQVAAVQDRLLDLRSRTDDLIVMNEAEVADLVARSSASAERAETIAWLAAGLSFLLALLTWLFLYRSISDPLRRLTRGTREIARGRFEHRLPEDGGTELSDLASDFNEMARKLGELNELKQDFVSHVSHELKGPLAAIQETILIFLEGIPGPITDRQRHLLELSGDSAARLSTMIENLLEASRLEAGAQEYDPIPHQLRDIVESVLAESEPVAEDRALRLNLIARGGDTRLLCDGDRIREVVANLVGNALKFSPREGRIRLTIGTCESPPPGVPAAWSEILARESAPYLLLSVEDDGPGVPDGHKEAVFEKFHQVQPGRRIQGQGVGLGLAISLGAVKAHGGAIWVEDGDEGGAVFRVLLPTHPSRWAGLDPEERDPRPGSGARTTVPPAPMAAPGRARRGGTLAS